jgi:hypothetical protein
MSSDKTIPMDFEARYEVLLQRVSRLEKQLAALHRQNWIREKENLSLKFELEAVLLRILELEEKEKGLDTSQSP